MGLAEKVEGRGRWVMACYGDFNEILKQSEMCVRKERNRLQILRFKEALWDCGLRDIEIVNGKFTYSNQRKGAEETKTRIDRAVANEEWLRVWPMCILQCCFANTSDHKTN